MGMTMVKYICVSCGNVFDAIMPISEVKFGYSTFLVCGHCYNTFFTTKKESEQISEDITPE